MVLEEDHSTSMFFNTIIIGLISTLISCFIMYHITTARWEKEVIKRGFAIRTVDQESGAVKFEWKTDLKSENQ
jgi:hypothetical protein